VRRALIISIATALVVGLVAVAGASTRPARTKIQIAGDTAGLGGVVMSRDRKCVKGRKVAVYKLRGSNPHPHNDLKFGTDHADSHGSWFVNKSDHLHGRFYAFAHKTRGCRKGISKIITD
jgi:hypothetical protein